MHDILEFSANFRSRKAQVPKIDSPCQTGQYHRHCGDESEPEHLNKSPHFNMQSNDKQNTSGCCSIDENQMKFIQHSPRQQNGSSQNQGSNDTQDGIRQNSFLNNINELQVGHNIETDFKKIEEGNTP